MGIYLPLSPDVQTEKIKHGNDYNFTSFSLITSMSRDEYYEKYKSKHADRKPFDACRDYEDYIRKLTSFVFEPPIKAGLRPSQPPLAVALPLMGSVLGGFGFAIWRRRRKQSA